MAQKPLSEMADRGYENMPEAAGYVLHEWKTHAIASDKILDKKLDVDEFNSTLQNVLTMLEGKLSASEFNTTLQIIMSALDQKASMSDLISQQTYIEKNIVEANSINTSINIISAKLDAIINAVKAMADKLDAENVTNLDTDYRATVDAELA
jgi:hypothetical protein